MGKIKEFFKRHKGKILFVTCVVGSFIVGVLIERNGKKGWVDMNGKSYVSWRPRAPEDHTDLENVKAVMELNSGNSEQFAVIKDGTGNNNYIGIALSEGLLFPEEKKEESQDGSGSEENTEA